MRRRRLILTLLLVVLVCCILTAAVSASFYCDYAKYNRAFLPLCLWSLLWDAGIEWGDADDYGNG